MSGMRIFWVCVFLLVFAAPTLAQSVPPYNEPVIGWVILKVVKSKRDPRFLWLNKRYTEVVGLSSYGGPAITLPKPGDKLTIEFPSRVQVIDFATRGFAGAETSPVDRQIRSEDITPVTLKPGELVRVRRVQVSSSFEPGKLRVVWIQIETLN